MSLHNLPPSPPSSEGQASQPPPTPTTVTQATHPAPTKRSSRRANTAERRATHNAVERARRETLNGRFLDLAAMLPNLAAVRRPSKSAIVNSSIALIHAQRRQRVIAARELRLIKAENDALRQELNEWRARASLPRVEEPPRSTELIALLNLEEDPDMAEDEQRRAFEMRDAVYEDGEDLPEDNDDVYCPEMQQYGIYAQQGPVAITQPQRPPAQQAHPAHLAAQQQAVFAQQQAAIARANQLQMAAIHRPPQQAPATQAPPSYDAPLFADLGDNAYGQVFSPTAPQTSQVQAHWSQANSTLLTPPTTGHGPKPLPFVTTANQAFLTSYNQGVNLGVFNPTSFIAATVSSSEDETGSIGSSHGHDSTHVTGGSPTSIGSSPVEHQFAYNTGVHGFVQQQQQQRRPSINIPGQAFGSSKQASPYHQGATGAPFAAMGLVM